MNQSALTPVLDFLSQHAPFQQMAPAHVEFLAKRLQLGFYSRGEVITGPDDGPASRFFIIKQGRIRGESSQGETSEEEAWELVAGECFPVGALLARRPVHMIQRAVEETLCFHLDRESFDRLLALSPVFHDFCTRRIANLLDHALRDAQAASATRVSEDTSLNTRLSELIAREPITLPPTAPIRQALTVMHEERIGSVVVTDEQRHPLGVFTLHDVLSRVALPQYDLDSPLSDVMTPEPHTLPPGAFAYEAALLMARRGFGHICVADKGRLVGVISERNLFSLQRVGLVSLHQSITRAGSIDDLKHLVGDTHHLADQMLAQGASVDQLTLIISELNDHVTKRIITLCLAEHGTPDTPFTWLAFGSEGRGEQTLKTDQDNGILIHLPEGGNADQARAELLPMARRINEALAEVGFPLCPGNIMASNPECCLTLEEWRSRFERWIDQGTPEHLLKATIFFDFRPIYGDAAEIEPLRQALLKKTQHNSRFRRQLAANSMQMRPPLGLFGAFKLSSSGDEAHTLDLKLQGLTPFVDSARLIALAHQISETNTEGRLRAAIEAGALRQADVDAWCEAYQFIQLLRMRNHRQQAKEKRPLSNRLDPDKLNELDRRILKEAFRQGRKLQNKIALEYQL